MADDIKNFSNIELFEKYDGKRGNVASEMCRRAGTIQYLLKYATFDDERFYSCMQDTLAIFREKFLKEERKYAIG